MPSGGVPPKSFINKFLDTRSYFNKEVVTDAKLGGKIRAEYQSMKITETFDKGLDREMRTSEMWMAEKL